MIQFQAGPYYCIKAACGGAEYQGETEYQGEAESQSGAESYR